MGRWALAPAPGVNQDGNLSRFWRPGRLANAAAILPLQRLRIFSQPSRQLGWGLPCDPVPPVRGKRGLMERQGHERSICWAPSPLCPDLNENMESGAVAATYDQEDPDRQTSRRAAKPTQGTSKLLINQHSGPIRGCITHARDWFVWL